MYVRVYMIISWLKNPTRVGILVTITLTAAKLHFVLCSLFVGGGPFIPCQKAGDHFGRAEGGQAEVKALKDGGGSAAAMTVPGRKAVNNCTIWGSAPISSLHNWKLV